MVLVQSISQNWEEDCFLTLKESSTASVKTASANLAENKSVLATASFCKVMGSLPSSRVWAAEV